MCWSSGSSQSQFSLTRCENRQFLNNHNPASTWAFPRAGADDLHRLHRGDRRYATGGNDGVGGRPIAATRPGPELSCCREITSVRRMSEGLSPEEATWDLQHMRSL